MFSDVKSLGLGEVLMVVLAALAAGSCGQAKSSPHMPVSSGVGSQESASGASRGVDVSRASPGAGGGSADGGISDGSTVAAMTAVEPAEGGSSGDGVCPAGMILVDTTYCPRIERTCLEP